MGNDTLPLQKADDYLAYAKGAGHPARIELVVYHTANHGWTDSGLGTLREYPYLASTRNCPFALSTPRARLMLLIDGHERPFDEDIFEACIRDSLGYAMGYDEAMRARSTAAAIAFLERHLSP